MRKKIMLLMCMAALLVTFFSLSVVSANPESPDVTVVAAKVDNGTALELGLRIASKNDSFQSTGVVLQYDASALTPCGWADEVTDALLEKARVNPAEIEAGKNIWDYAVPLPTKGKDIISGKTAFTVIDTSTTPHTGYLYLNVEAPAPAYGIEQKKPGDMELTDLVEFTDPTPANFGYKTNHGLIDSPDGQAVDQVITVRFALPTEPEQPVDPTPDPEEPTPEPNPDENEPSGQADETGDGTGEGGGTTEPEPTDPTEPDPDNPENPDDPPAEQPDDFMATYGIAVSAATVVDESPAGHSGVYYRTTDTLPEEISNWHFLSVKNGVSVNTGSSGPASPDDFAAVVFYDWDGSTMIGAIIMNRALTLDQVQKSIQDFVKDHEDVFTTKKGYTFENVWLDYNSNIPTRYGRYIAPGVTTLIPESDIDEKDHADFTRLANGETMVVKAAYRGTVDAGLTSSTGAAANRYRVTADSYSRLGMSEIYSVTFKIERLTTSNVPVPRAAAPVLRIQTISDSGEEGYIMVQLPCNDLEYGTVTVPGTVATVRGYVVDNYEFENWVGAATRSGTATVNRDGEKGYMHQGILGYINIELSKGDSGNILDTDLVSVGVDLKGLDIDRVKNILVAKRAELGRDLTVSEMQTEIDKNI